MPLNFYRPIIYCFNHKKSNSTFPNLITREAYIRPSCRTFKHQPSYFTKKAQGRRLCL